MPAVQRAVAKGGFRPGVKTRGRMRVRPQQMQRGQMYCQTAGCGWEGPGDTTPDHWNDTDQKHAHFRDKPLEE